MANQYAEGGTHSPGGNVRPSQIEMRNPLFSSGEIHDVIGQDGRIAEIIDRAKADGHDGVVFGNAFGAGSHLVVAFDPRQIRSSFEPGVRRPPTQAERSQILQSALRDASGQRPPDPTSLAAERALKEGTEKNLLKLAQQDIEDHTAFFKAMSDANLTGATGTNAPTRFIGKDWLHKAGDDEKGIYDMGVGSDALDKEVSDALDRGEKVTLVADGGRREIPIVAVVRGMMQDAEGQRWGTMSMLGDRSGKEGVRIEGGREVGAAVEIGQYAGLTADVRAELEAINGLDEEATNLTKAAKQAAACIARGMA